MGKDKEYKRRRLRPDRPLEVGVMVEAEVPGPPPALWAARPLGALLRWLPTFRDTGRGRDRVRIWRWALILTAAAIAWKGGVEWMPLVATAVLALAAVLLPVAHSRKQRWERWVRGLAQPALERREVAAELYCDGAKITIRQGGRVWGSLRPVATSSEVVVGTMEDLVYLGFCPDGGKKREALWFVGPRTDLPETVRIDPLRTGDRERLWRPVRLQGDGWARLYEAFTHPRFMESRAP